MICDLPQTNLRVGYSGNEPGRLFIAELGGQSVCEVHYTSSLLWCVFEIPYNTFFRHGATMDENVGECDHHWQAQGSHYTTYFGVYLYVFTMKICSDVVLLKASLSAPPCCPRMEHRSSRSCTHNPSPLVTVPASCATPHPRTCLHLMCWNPGPCSVSRHSCLCPPPRTLPCPFGAHLETPSAKRSRLSPQMAFSREQI